MKIDPTIPSNGELQSGRVQTGKTDAFVSQSQAKPASQPPAHSEDTVQLSSRHGEVQSLAAQAAQLPEVRTQQVAAFQSQVRSGSYQPNSQRIAASILGDQNSRATKP